MSQQTKTQTRLSPQQTSSPSIKWWRCLLPIAAQTLIVVSIPAQNAYTLATGTTVYLETAPVDPYDVLRGRYVTLNYVVTRSTTLKSLPGWSQEFHRSGTELFLVLQAPDQEEPTPWKAVSIHDSFPENVQPDQQVIKGFWRNWRFHIGLSEYYIPEAIGDELEDQMRQHRGDGMAEVKVDGQGNAALVQLWVGNRQY